MYLRFFTSLICVIIFLHSSANLSYAQSGTITILHTNDIHGSFLPHEASWISSDEKPLVGGFNELKWMSDSIKQKKDQVIMLDGGDVMTGNPIADMEYRDSRGGALFKMMNQIGYDAWTVGNHDLDISQENLRALTEIAEFPAVSANLTDSSGRHPLNNKPAVVLTRGGLRIGIVGIISGDLFRLTNTKNLKGLMVRDAKEVLKRVIDSLDHITDLLIALTHQGYAEDSVLAESINGLDVIIGAHSHTRLERSRLINGVIIAQAGAYCENLGELELNVADDKVVWFEGRLHRLWVRHQISHNPLNQLVEKYASKLDKEYGTVIGKAVVPLKRSRSEETIIGTFVAEAVRIAAGADIGIINSSGLRKDIQAGPITKMKIYEAIPFRNFICTFQINGRNLRKIIEEYVGSLKNRHTSLNFANVGCVWERRGGDHRILSIFIGPEEIKDDKSYCCATIDYVMDQSERYLGFVPDNAVTSDKLIFDAVVRKIEREREIGHFAAPGFSER